MAKVKKISRLFDASNVLLKLLKPNFKILIHMHSKRRLGAILTSHSLKFTGLKKMPTDCS